MASSSRLSIDRRLCNADSGAIYPVSNPANPDGHVAEPANGATSDAADRKHLKSRIAMSSSPSTSPSTPVMLPANLAPTTPKHT